MGGGRVSRAVLGSNEVTRQRFNAGTGVKPFRKEGGSLARGEKVNLASVNSSVLLPATIGYEYSGIARNWVEFERICGLSVEAAYELWGWIE